ncbi:unnamed protein product [Caenorhabditis auriculariae]|uniref:Uncharacterized protein n=1 Tax=Caenorhabditis auriculariae TaxID=2777116 RepID=A0A8S1HRT9_9PELO|nr:unnamed protein product [Caenorhabditis auriculariae]
MNHEPPHIPGNTAINLKTGETLPINTNTFSDAPKTAMPNASNYPTSTGITTYDVSKHRLDEEYPSEHHDTVLHNAKEKSEGPSEGHKGCWKAP